MFMTVVDLKVLGPVVRFYAVNVVNRFVALKAAAQLLLHLPAVLKNVAFVGLGIRMLWHTQEHVAEPVGVAALAPLHSSGVVPGDEATHDASAGVGQMSASTSAKLRLDRLALVMSLEKAHPVLIPQVRAP